MARELTVGALARGLVTDCPPGFVVRGDANRLEQVLVNLFANALQTGGDPVTVALADLDGHIEVHDNRWYAVLASAEAPRAASPRLAKAT